MVRSILFVAVLALVFGTTPAARAESTDDFILRIEAAYAAPDRLAALKALFLLDGMDAETRQWYEDRIIARFLMAHEGPAISLEPLPGDFQPLQVGGGYEYRPNLRPLGYVVLDEKTRVLYGMRGDRYFLTGLSRTPITDPAGPEQMLQMIVLGFGNPQIRFDGHCDVLLANRTVQRVRLHDEGLTSKTMLITGVRIETCELRNLSGHGAVMLRLLEGDDQIFDRQVDFPDTAVSFTR